MINDHERNRRYGRRHRNVRAVVKEQVDAGGVSCCRCGRLIPPGSEFHLDHNDDGPGYRGAAHPTCNISANEGGWRERHEQGQHQQHRAMTDDELYCGMRDAPIGTFSTDGRHIKRRGGSWTPVWVYERFWADG